MNVWITAIPGRKEEKFLPIFPVCSFFHSIILTCPGSAIGKRLAISPRLSSTYVCIWTLIWHTKPCLYLPLLTIPIFPLSTSLEKFSTTSRSPILLITSIHEFGLYLCKHGNKIEGIERYLGSSCLAHTILLFACANPKAPWLYFQICANPLVLFIYREAGVYFLLYFMETTEVKLTDFCLSLSLYCWFYFSFTPIFLQKVTNFSNVIYVSILIYFTLSGIMEFIVQIKALCMLWKVNK